MPHPSRSKEAHAKQPHPQARTMLKLEEKALSKATTAAVVEQKILAQTSHVKDGRKIRTGSCSTVVHPSSTLTPLDNNRQPLSYSIVSHHGSHFSPPTQAHDRSQKHKKSRKKKTIAGKTHGHRLLRQSIHTAHHGRTNSNRCNSSNNDWTGASLRGQGDSLLQYHWHAAGRRRGDASRGQNMVLVVAADDDEQKRDEQGS